MYPSDGDKVDAVFRRLGLGNTTELTRRLRDPALAGFSSPLAARSLPFQSPIKDAARRIELVESARFSRPGRSPPARTFAASANAGDWDSEPSILSTSVPQPGALSDLAALAASDAAAREMTLRARNRSFTASAATLAALPVADAGPSRTFPNSMASPLVAAQQYFSPAQLEAMHAQQAVSQQVAYLRAQESAYPRLSAPPVQQPPTYAQMQAQVQAENFSRAQQAAANAQAYMNAQAYANAQAQSSSRAQPTVPAPAVSDLGSVDSLQRLIDAERDALSRDQPMVPSSPTYRDLVARNATGFALSSPAYAAAALRAGAAVAKPRVAVSARVADAEIERRGAEASAAAMAAARADALQPPGYFFIDPVRMPSSTAAPVVGSYANLHGPTPVGVGQGLDVGTSGGRRVPAKVYTGPHK